MSEADGQEKTLDASAHKLRQAREDGDVAISREGAVAGVYLGALLTLVVLAEPIAQRVGGLLLPLIEQPEAFLAMTPAGWQQIAQSAFEAIGLAILPFFGIICAAALLPYVVQNVLVASGKRIMPKASHLSLGKGVKRIFGHRALFEFAKSITKMTAVGVACWLIARPIYTNSVGLVMTDVLILPDMLTNALAAVLAVVTVIAVVIAGIDLPYQHWSHRRRLRMSVQEMRDELRSTEGDPLIRLRQRKLRQSRLRGRMLHDVPTATVVVTNPTHIAIALRYERGRDPAPVVVAKGADLLAERIRGIAFDHQIAIVENKPLARALHRSTEVGEVIPAEYFELAAKIISLVWSRSGRVPQGPGQPHARSS
jgi:flagellar biosynthetic protein FlhB